MQTADLIAAAPSDLSEDAAEAQEAHADGRALIRDGASASTIGVYWLPAPASLAPGGPWVEVEV